jgi:hypothetical protein
MEADMFNELLAKYQAQFGAGLMLNFSVRDQMVFITVETRVGNGTLKTNKVVSTFDMRTITTIDVLHLAADKAIRETLDAASAMENTHGS